MSDPADKSDDLIAELAKLMAAPTGGNKPSVQPMARPAPIDPLATTQSSPMPIRIPGMDAPRSVAAAPAPQPAPRAPVTGAIRIPGMDQPAPVSTSAPVSKFDFGKPISAATPIRQEPISSLSERLAAQNPSPAPRTEPSFGLNPQPAPRPIRVPSDLRPISENRSFAQGPALSVAPPAPAPVPQAPVTPPSNGNNDYAFDFGFGRNPPASAAPPRPTPVPANDPIADLIAAEMADESPALAPPPRPAPAPVQMTPVARTQVTPQPVVAKPSIAPIQAAQPRPAANAPIPLKPVSVAPRAPESDRFAISPGVGLNMKPAATQPLSVPAQRAPEPAPRPARDESDPMSEIESLIGEAVRVELSAPGPVRVQAAPMQMAPQIAPHVEFESEEDLEEEIHARPQASSAPVVPPLNTQFAPRRSGLKDDIGHSGAEEAILAAAAATGAQVDRIDPPIGDESPYRRLKVKPAKSSFASGGMRQYVGMAVAGTLLLAAGLGLYWVLNMGRTANVNTAASAPQLTADATPVKEVPKIAAATETDTARSPVLEQMGGTSAATSAEQLVSTDETSSGAPVTRDVTAAAGEDTEGGLANRKVRTVTVRPDGTIVSGDDAVAGAEELPVDRPNVPSVPSTETTNLLGDTTQVAMTDPVAGGTALTLGTVPTADAAVTGITELQPVFDPTIVAPKPLTFPARSAQVTAFAAEEPTPVTAEVTGATTPNGQIDLLSGGNTEPTRVAAVEPTPIRASNAAAYVQLSSSPSEADAKSSLRGLNSRFGSLFGGNELIVQSADLGQKGTWYRVKLPAASLGEAQKICQQIKSNGGDCIVSGG
ncbi:MAG: SPOR domain-containing protein [Devosia sp.]